MSNPIREFQGEYRWLSNFWPCSVLLDGVEYRSVEHAFQAAKTLNLSERARVQACATPGSAKREGRRVTLRHNWNILRTTVMLDLLRQKFYTEPLRSKLLSTGDSELIEGNNWGDTFWGVCRGIGQNVLGKLLMSVRHELS